MRTTSNRRPASAAAVRPVLVALALALILVSATTAVLFTPPGAEAAAWWPAAGIAVALILSTPHRRAAQVVAAVAVVTAAANLLGGRGIGLAVPYGLLNAAEAAVVAVVMRRGRVGDERPTLTSIPDLLRLLTATLCGTAVIGVGVGLVFVIAQDPSGFTVPATRVALAHAAALLCLTPLALVVGRPSYRTAGGVEAAAQALGLAAVFALVFARDSDLSLTFAPMALLVWGGLRLGAPLVLGELALLATATVAATAAGHGPFSTGRSGAVGGGETIAVDTTVTLVQVYLVCLALVALALVCVMGYERYLAAAVAEREELFRRIFSDSLVGKAIVDRDAGGQWTMRQLNAAGARLLGARADLSAVPLDRHLAFDAPPAAVRDAFDAGRPWTVSAAVVGRPDRRLELSFSPLHRGRTGAASSMTVEIHDHSREHQARRDLHAERETSRSIIDSAPCYVLVADLDGVVLRVNHALVEGLGWQPDQIVGEPAERHLAPPAAMAAQAWWRAWTSAERLAEDTGEIAVCTSGGEQRQVLWRRAVLRDGDRPVAVVLCGLDVTEERATRTLLSQVLDAARTTVVVATDDDGRVTLWNSGAAALSGTPADGAVGRALADLVPPDARVALDDLARRARSQADEPEAIVGADVPWRGRQLALTLSRLRDASGAPSGYLCTGHDATDERDRHRLTEDALAREREVVRRLRELDTAQHDFVSTASHELRTPVTSIVGYAALLTDGTVGEPAPQQRRLLDAIQRSSERLIELSDHLLALSGLDGEGAAEAAGRRREPCDLAAIALEATEALRMGAESRGVRLVTDAEVAVVVHGDPVRLRQLVTNLVSNAVKFSPGGGDVQVAVACADGRAVLRVRDAGIGIPAAEQAQIFTRFFRSTSSRRKAIQGTGLGLAIAAGIVAQHDGEIDVESDEGRGSTFTVRLPLSSSR